jgi:hypothetical protein
MLNGIKNHGMKELVKKPTATATHEKKPLLSGSEPFFSAAPVSVQAKTEVSQPGDPLEKEADMTADRIMAKSEPGGTSQSAGENPGISSAAPTSPETSGITGGNPMNTATREKMEDAFGTDFSGVKVHTGPEAVSMNRSLGAQAFTYGSDIYFNNGKYDPSTSQGQHLIAHELTHVVQQVNGKKSISRKIGDGHDLKATRFQGDPDLEDIYDGVKLAKNGSKGTHIVLIQQALIDSGFPLPKYQADGSYGSETQNAVKMFQAAIGFSKADQDGVIGKKTMEALDARFTEGAKTPVPEVPKSVDPAKELAYLTAKMPVMMAVAMSNGYKALNPAEMLKFSLYIGGFDPYISKPAYTDFSPKFASGAFDATKPESFRDYLKAQPGVPQLVASGPNLMKEKRAATTKSGPEEVSKFKFRSGKADAHKYLVKIGSVSIPVYLPKNPDPAKGNFHTIDEVANGLGILPAVSLAAVVAVHVEPNQNPDDAYWAKEYKKPGFRSYMTAGSSGIINIYPTKNKQGQGQMDTSMIHETGHIISQRRFGEDSSKGRNWTNWSRAASEDIIIPSGYAKSSPAEDFSESLALFSQVAGTIYDAQIRALMPERSKILDTVRSPDKHS